MQKQKGAPPTRVLKYKEKEPYRPASALRISTISAVSFLNAKIDFAKLFDRLPLVSKDSAKTGVFSVKYYEKDAVDKSITRRVRHRDDATGETCVTTKVKTYFQNQITIIWTFHSSKGDVRTTNGFMFANGKIKGVGLKCDADIERSFESLRRYLEAQLDLLGDAVAMPDSSLPALSAGVTHTNTIKTGTTATSLTATTAAATAIASLHLEGTRATMYNTDFSTHFQIIREELFRVILEEYGLVYSEFEPDIYPAVKIKFAWNRMQQQQQQLQPGTCHCKARCNGKGNGDGDGHCKVVTICVFGNDAPNQHGGKIIITGANEYDQVTGVYAFINSVLKTHYDAIVYQAPYMALVGSPPTSTSASTAKAKSTKKANPSKVNPSDESDELVAGLSSLQLVA
jgi:hypothetical protein